MLTSDTIWVALVAIVFLVSIPAVILLLRAGNRQNHSWPRMDTQDEEMKVHSMAEFPETPVDRRRTIPSTTTEDKELRSRDKYRKTG